MTTIRTKAPEFFLYVEHGCDKETSAHGFRAYAQGDGHSHYNASFWAETRRSAKAKARAHIKRVGGKEADA